MIEDEQLLAALDGGPSFELWPSGNLRVGRRWCFSGDEIERRLGPLGIDYGSLNLVVERIGREPATALQTAYLKGSLHAVLPHRGLDTLLKARVSADVSLRLGMALRLDINGRYQGKSLEPIIRGLLRSGADPDKASASGETPLMLAMKRILDQTELVRLLLEAGADPGKRDGRGNTLLQAGADVHARNSFQETPLLSAAAKGRVEVMD